MIEISIKTKFEIEYVLNIHIRIKIHETNNKKPNRTGNFRAPFLYNWDPTIPDILLKIVMIPLKK